MLDMQYYFWVLCNGMKTRFRMVMIAHPGPGIGFHKRFRWRIIILPTPGHVTSDHGTEFMPHFFHSLGSLLSMKLHFTSGYHLEGDGQTEWINQVLEQYLQAYTNYQQDNWALLLPLAEFAYNNAMSATTGISPFFVNKGYHLRLSTNLLAPSLSSEAQCYVADLDQLHSQLKVSIAEAQECYQKAADAITSLQDW